MNENLVCSDCSRPVNHCSGPEEGWELEDGRLVCHDCCVADTQKIVATVINKSIGRND